MEEQVRSRKSSRNHVATINNGGGAGGGGSICDLPDHILTEICSKLSVKSICRCRSANKHLFHLLTNPNFIQLHFDRAPTLPLLCPNYGRPSTLTTVHRPNYDEEIVVVKNRSSKSLSLLEFERDITLDPDSSQNHYLTAFKLPQPKSPPRKLSWAAHQQCKRMRVDYTQPVADSGFTIVNSCNGFLCLRGDVNHLPLAIYNPITGEYSILPIPENFDDSKDVSVYGIGFGPNTNQYKILLTLNVEDHCGGCDDKYNCQAKLAYIYTLGQLEGGGWRKVESPPCFGYCSVLNPAFLNGVLHWLVKTDLLRQRPTKSIMSFDFEAEKFRKLPAPPCFNRIKEEMRWCPWWKPVKVDMILGLVRGHLYLCNRVNSDLIDVWVMKDYGVKESWTKEYVIDANDGEKWSLATDFTNDWDLLIHLPQQKSIYFIDEYQSIRSIAIDGDSKSDFEVFAYVPNFLSMKNIVGNTLEVLNVRSA